MSKIAYTSKAYIDDRPLDPSENPAVVLADALSRDNPAPSPEGWQWLEWAEDYSNEMGEGRG